MLHIERLRVCVCVFIYHASLQKTIFSICSGSCPCPSMLDPVWRFTTGAGLFIRIQIQPFVNEGLMCVHNQTPEPFESLVKCVPWMKEFKRTVRKPEMKKKTVRLLNNNYWLRRDVRILSGWWCSVILPSTGLLNDIYRKTRHIPINKLRLKP